MITLVLVRHAKSDWGDPMLADHDRPLNDRGLRDAPRMAERVAATGIRPDVILASTALRARSTAEAFATVLGVVVTTDRELYGSSARVLLAAAEASGHSRVMLVAHNPGISELADTLSGGGIAPMPTAAVATFEWDQDDWAVATALDPDRWTLSIPD